MSKSRVKSNEEYDKILGVEKEQVELVTTNNAIEYFESLKATQVSETNPFERTLSLKEIKANLRTGTTGSEIENIKAEIANAQASSINEVDFNLTQNDLVSPKVVKRVEKQSNLYQDLENTSDIQTKVIQEEKSFTYEENASKLYDNLRDSRPEIKFNNQNTSRVNQEIKKIDIVERPSSLTEQRVNKLFINSNVLEDEPVIPVSIDVSKNYEPELAADFTGENNKLLDSIKKKQTIENETDVNFNNITKT
ncbi:MAG: hypothetical protein ACRCTA_04060, partial [Bacilli bacterium]